MRSSVVAHQWLPRRCIAVLEAGTRAAQLWSLRRKLDTRSCLRRPWHSAIVTPQSLPLVRGGGYVRVPCIETEHMWRRVCCSRRSTTGTILRSLSPESTHGIAMRATRSSRPDTQFSPAGI